MSKSNARTLIVTGGGTGIGLETARRWIRLPQTRLILVGKDAPVLEKASQELFAEPALGAEPARDRIRTFTCDLRDAKQITDLGERLKGEYQGIYGLVNNAGTYPFGQLATTTLEAWNETIATNLTSAFLVTQAIVPIMAKAKRGRIINVSSTAGILPNHFALGYSVSKSALIQLSKTLAKELGKDGITVNCVCPGIVRSPMHQAYHSGAAQLEEFYAKKGSQFPTGRVGEPRDVANVIEFFLREESDWVTGEVFVVDGGRLLT